MRLGDTVGVPAENQGKPLDGVRILALEQMQALPFATQLLGRLGADVVKVESPGTGDPGRLSQPSVTAPDGTKVGATFLRNNLNKRSVVIDLKDPRGRDLAVRLAGGFDVLAESFKPGGLDRLGLGYDDLAAIHPALIYASVTGFGHGDGSPYRSWGAYAPVVEAMSGLYETKRHRDDPPVVAPAGALADMGTALFTAVGILAALRHRDRTGCGQHLDLAMYDATIAMTDLVANYWSMGLPSGEPAPLIMHGFRAQDGWFVLQVGRDPEFARLAATVDRPSWLTDPRLATHAGWLAEIETEIRPAVERWAANRTKLDACRELAAAGLVAGPCFSDAELVADPHVVARHMLVEIPRTDGVAQPVLIPGDPIKLSAVAQGPDRAGPGLGEHTDSVLRSELGLDDDAIAALRADGVIA
jgi:crotonobetainyl-CoA:carnitine CoA-transferase CaiB-like acyl-CoA transferase